MTDRIKLNRLESTFSELSYPTTRDTVADRYDDTTVVFADGEANLGDLLEELTVEQYEDPSELFAELQNVVPIEAVGEPGQSDGDA